LLVKNGKGVLKKAEKNLSVIFLMIVFKYYLSPGWRGLPLNLRPALEVYEFL